MIARELSNEFGPDSFAGQKQEHQQSAVSMSPMSTVDVVVDNNFSSEDNASLLPATAEKVTSVHVDMPRSLSESNTSRTSNSTVMTASSGEPIVSGDDEDNANGPPDHTPPGRSNSLGAVALSQQPSCGAASNSGGDRERRHLSGLLQKLHLSGSRRDMMAHARAASSGDVLDVSNHGRHHQKKQQQEEEEEETPPPPKGSSARETFHYRCFMDDSITVQKRHGRVLDDEKHEDNPHLEDYLHPHHFVHVEGQQSILHTETHLLRAHLSTAAITAEEESVSDSVTLVDTAEEGGSDDDVVLDVERVEVEDTPVTAVAHTMAKPLKSCMKKPRGNVPEHKKRTKKNVVFHEVTVRDYSITLGDHPNVSYGPPIMLSWDYLEYDPLAIDEYEIHHEKRRNMRQMMLNYYRRRDMLLCYGEYNQEELRAAWKAVKKVKRQRYITRSYFTPLPVRVVEDACESAVRKIKRRMSKSGTYAL